MKLQIENPQRQYPTWQVKGWGLELMKNTTRIECADELPERLRKGATILRSLKELRTRNSSRLLNTNLEQFANDCEEAARLLYHSRVKANRLQHKIISGALKLADISDGQFGTRCTKCGLTGIDKVDNLIAVYGAEYLLADLVADMKTSCSSRLNAPCEIDLVDIVEKWKPALS